MQAGQWPQNMKVSTTWSPTASLRTAEPTFSTMPAPSWPSTIGCGMCGASLAIRSVWHMPAATTRTSTSSGRGCSSFSASMLNGPPGSRETAAVMSIRSWGTGALPAIS